MEVQTAINRKKISAEMGTVGSSPLLLLPLEVIRIKQ